MAVLKLLQAGLLAAFGQMSALTILTAGLVFLDANDWVIRKHSDNTQAFCAYYVPFLTATYVVLAAGFAIWTSKCVLRSAQIIRRIQPSQEHERMVALFGILAVLLIAIALRPEEVFVVMAAYIFSDECLARMVCTAAISVCAAFCGAMANSAFVAGKLERRN